jgi:hypothetical protein
MIGSTLIGHVNESNRGVLLLVIKVAVCLFVSERDAVSSQFGLFNRCMMALLSLSHHIFDSTGETELFMQRVTVSRC